MSLEETVREQLAVALILAPRRNWDNWCTGMAMALSSPLDSAWTPEQVKEELMKQLFDKISEGCCDG